MTAEEVFSKVSAHMVEGFMLHDQLADSFAFLGLSGFHKEQEFHFFEELNSYRRIRRYYLEHYGKLLPEEKIDSSSKIPTGWYGHARKDVDTSTRRSGIRDNFDAWVKWETDTKTVYSDAVADLRASGDEAGAIFIGELVMDVCGELWHAEAEQLKLDAIGYDMPTIMAEQDELRARMEKKIKEMGV